MNTYVILSNRKWSEHLFTDLEKRVHGNWVFISDRSKVTLNYFEELQPRYIFIPNWSHKIDAEIIRKFNCVIFHETDLPSGRGGSPIQNLIARGFDETVLSSIRASDEIDAGPIYLKCKVSLLGGIEEIFLRMNKVIEGMIVQIIEEDVIPVDQEGEISLFVRRTPEESRINDLDSIEQVFDWIRMLDSEYYPKAFYENDKFIFEFSRPSMKGDKSIRADVRIIKK